ncbi:MAG: glycoside hydrolase family 88 protein [Dysgonamonadaceae bacterium]|jgi:rhamnogalacturonyl hydrolase YesR|nr:glycoside hydrolase family 88 protein [Dysgonamonadaceae bacterium]
MKKQWMCLLFSSVFLFPNLYSQNLKEPPVESVKKIGDKLIRETPFAYKLVVAPNTASFNNLKFIDFGRTFGMGKEAVAYAYTQLSFSKDTTICIETEHNDACKIWCNGKLVYEKQGKRKIQIKRDERSMKMSFSFDLPLKKGLNDLLIKSETTGNDWCVFMQPPSKKDAVLTTTHEYPGIGLGQIKNTDPKVSELTDWLVVGPFPPGINTPHEPEQEFRFGRMYNGLDRLITWTIPKIEILGNMIDPAPWGTTYQWNYHNSGVAWAMQQLGELSKEQKYTQWANNYCDYQMEGMPFVNYQVNELKAYNSANALVIGSTLLDFTLAPSLPLIYRLRMENEFKGRKIYESYIDKMMHYARFEQIRSERMTNYTRNTPEEFTVWVDDMFMGIPFLIQAGLYTDSMKLKKIFFDDAAGQVLDFHKHIWDKDAGLYMHANYTSRPEIKLPHWSRANGWAIWAMSEVLMALPKNHPDYAEILKQYRTFVHSLIKFQDDSGFWHNVIDRKDSPEEVSGTAIFTMAIARGVRYGWLDSKKFIPLVMKGWEAVASEIENDGTVHKICVGTMCSEDINYYMNRPFYDNDTHGSFAVIFAGIEVQRMINEKQK